ncbi:MAG: hypothetical protein L0H41_16955 [Microlunatus sp.]|nr:hypothetical protein [Microlunatus sp.]
MTTDTQGGTQLTKIDARSKRTQRRIAAQLATIDWALPGTITERMMRCGKKGCRCGQGPPHLHGPYLQWTRTVNGKTVTKLLTREQLDRYQPWLDNARQLRALTSELEALTTQTVTDAEGWGAKS